MTTIIFGGSFDPVHKGHIALALSALDFTGADRLFMIPAGVSPFKTGYSMADNNHRLEMCRLATENYEKIIVSDLEFSLPQPSYTVNTLMKLREIYPDDRFILLCGSDAFITLDQWKDYKTLLASCDILTTVRNEDEAQQVKTKAKQFQASGNILIMDMPKVPVSSTAIRNSSQKGCLLREYLPEGVAEYIQNNNLYRR